MGALLFLVSVATVALIAAAVYSYNAPDARAEKERVAFFFDLAKYILATVLPVVAGRVGTVLAFYYGKENFEAGTKTVTTAAQALTSKEKLAATLAVSLGKAKSDFKALVLTKEESADPKKVRLNELKKSSLQQAKKINLMNASGLLPRRPSLHGFASEHVKFFPGRSEQSRADQKHLRLPLGNLYDKVDYLPLKSFVTVAPDATAAQAETEMEKIENCSDVFVTVNGKVTSAVIRWITNVDLLKAARSKLIRRHRSRRVY